MVKQINRLFEAVLFFEYFVVKKKRVTQFMNAEMRWSPIQKVLRSASTGYSPNRQKVLLGMLLSFFIS